jgi:hypothetical protein
MISLLQEWEAFLEGILDAIEQSGAHNVAAASHKASNAWYKAFDLIYGNVASDYSIPTGKNRYHKFKDKIVEVWCALEQDAPADHPCREKAMGQLETYRQACSDANKPTGGPSPATGTPNKSRASAAGRPAAAAGSAVSAKRGLLGGASGGVVIYKNLDEKDLISKLPGTLQNLFHLRQLSKEMTASTAVRASRKPMEDHSKTVDAAYLEALAEYLGPACDDDGDKDDKKDGETMDKDEAYDRAQCLALLHRYANPGSEQNDIAVAYRKAVDQYVSQVSSVATVAAVEGETIGV